MKIKMLLNDHAITISDIYFRGGIVPAGFKYDGMSVPRLLWVIAGHPFQGRGVRAACIHDWLYSVSHLYAHTYTRVHTRKDCDKIFYTELLIANRRYYKKNPTFFIFRRIADCRCFVKYLVARLFGWRYFRKQKTVRKAQ